MKKFLLLFLTFIALNVTGQDNDYFKIKEGSFKHISMAVWDDNKEDHRDIDNNPMALFKISTENINDEQRRKLYFTGNRVTEISDKVYKTGAVWIYITAQNSDYLEIRHPDYGITRFYFPESLCDFCTYEMVLQYIDPTPAVETGFLAISSEPDEADIYIDGELQEKKTNTVITNLTAGSHTLKLNKQGYNSLTKPFVITKGETLELDEKLQKQSNEKYHLIVKADQPEAMIFIDDNVSTGEASLLVAKGTTHTWKIECDLYHSETGTVTVNERVTIDKKLRPAYGYLNITTMPEQGAKVYVDGKYLGDSPIKTDKLASGSHTVRVMKDMYKMKEQSFTVNDAGQTTNAFITMTANFVNVTVNADSQSDIYVDEEYKGKGRWTGRVSDGSHIFEARKANHKASRKTLDLALGENKTITLDAPKPINGSCEISSSPMGATIYIDGKSYGETPNYINEILIGTHELKLEKQGCTTITKTISIKEGETLTVNEKLQTGKEIVIKTDKSGDKVYVDNNYVGLSPVTTSLAFGSHDIKAERDGKAVSKTINVSQYGGDNSVMLAFVQEINGHEYVDLGLSVKWATCNVGASSPEDYGNYYAWGETKTKYDYSSSNSVTEGKNYSDIGGNSQYDAARANWGGSWRLPTKKELEELRNKCTWTWTTQNGVNGYKVTGPNGNSIFLPAAGCCYGSSLGNAGENGYCWSSTPNDSHSNFAYDLGFDSGDQSVDWSLRYFGKSVRPVSDEEDIYIVSVNNETITVNGVSFTMIKVEGGTFQMGAQYIDPSGTNYDSDANSDEYPVHSVTLSDYYIGETEVTQELWEAVMGSNPSNFKGSHKPVESVSWYDCKEFITKLNKLTGKNFRLPTEAEWEYAARGGNESQGYKYSGSNTIGNVAWYDGNSGLVTHNVKTKLPNELGIYDMSGNVYEWCEDRKGGYSSGSQTNPAGPSTGSYRVPRGGCWFSNAWVGRVSCRYYGDPYNRYNYLGLRLCLSQY